MLKTFLNKLIIWGINPYRTIFTLKNLPYYYKDLRKFKKSSPQDSPFKITKNPQLGGKLNEGGNTKGHYFYQDLSVAQKIFKNNPVKHVDIGSRVDGFVAHVASFREIEVFDIRPVTQNIPNVTFTQADLTLLDSKLKNYTDSISCLHALEHIGLGRYGDKIDPDGHIKGFNSIYTILKKGGTFYFSVPIGPLRIEFNAHRVFSLSYLLSMIQTKYEIISFSYVNDKGFLIKDAALSEENTKSNFNCKYGLAIFELIKI